MSDQEQDLEVPHANGHDELDPEQDLEVPHANGHEELDPEYEEGSSSEDDESGQPPLFELQVHTDSVCSVALHPLDGSIFASGGVDDKAYLKVGEEMTELSLHTDTVVQVAFSHDGKYLATAGMDAKLGIWKVEAPNEVHRTLEGPGAEINWIQWHPKGPAIVAGSEDLTIWVWSLSAPIAILIGHEGPTKVGGFSENGQLVWGAGEDSQLRIWSMKEAAEMQAPWVQSIRGGYEYHRSPIHAGIMLDDNSVVVTGDAEGVVWVAAKTASRVLHKAMLFEEGIESIVQCLQLPLVAVGSLTGRIAVINMSDYSIRLQMDLHSAVIRLLFVGIVIYSCHAGGGVYAHDARSGEFLERYRGADSDVLDIAASQGHLAVGTDAHQIFVYNLYQSN